MCGYHGAYTQCVNDDALCAIGLFRVWYEALAYDKEQGTVLFRFESMFSGAPLFHGHLVSSVHTSRMAPYGAPVCEGKICVYISFHRHVSVYMSTTDRGGIFVEVIWANYA